LLSRFAPQTRRLLDQPGLGAVTRQNLGLTFGNLSKIGFKRFDDATVKRTSRLAQ